MLLTVKKPGS